MHIIYILTYIDAFTNYDCLQNYKNSSKNSNDWQYSSFPCILLGKQTRKMFTGIVSLIAKCCVEPTKSHKSPIQIVITHVSASLCPRTKSVCRKSQPPDDARRYKHKYLQ